MIFASITIIWLDVKFQIIKFNSDLKFDKIVVTDSESQTLYLVKIEDNYYQSQIPIWENYYFFLKKLGKIVIGVILIKIHLCFVIVINK